VETGFIVYQPKEGAPSILENRVTQIGGVKLARQATMADIYRILCEMKARLEQSATVDLMEQVIAIGDKKPAILKPSDLTH